MSIDLNAMIDNDELDLAVVMDIDDGAGGETLRVEPLIWSAGETFRHVRSSLPLALYPPPCINRRVALDALGQHQIPWHVAFTCPSPEGIVAALRSGLAITVLGETELKKDVRDVGKELGLPPLPRGVFRLRRSGISNSAVAQELAQLLQCPREEAKDQNGSRR